MRHADLLRSTAATPVIQPWDYVAMRRRAAGLTQERLAAALSPRNEPHTYLLHVRALETEGLRFQHLIDLSRVMPFSMDVYRQLADLPPDRHPRLCQGCGWDAHTEQADQADDLTAWSRADDGICTRCEQAERH